MAHSLTPANVNSPVVTAIAIADPAALFTGGVEVGLKKPVKLAIEPITVGMSSMNDLLDAVRVKCELESLQNTVAALAAAYTWAQDAVQVIFKTSDGKYIECTGQTIEDETTLGLEFEYIMKNNDASLKYILSGEMGVATFEGIEKTTTTNTWTAGEDPTKRRRSGVKKVLIGGVDYGVIEDINLSLKSKSLIAQGGKALLEGTDISCELVLGQTAKADIDAALDDANGNGTIAIYFWNGEQVNFTTLRGGKIPTIELGDKHRVKIQIKAFIAKGSTRVDFTGGTNTIANFTLLDNEAHA
jgi:hypothetical protein